MLETEQPQIGLNILQNQNGVSIIISNRFRDNGVVLHKLKQKGFSTKTGHQGIGLSNAQKIIGSCMKQPHCMVVSSSTLS